MIGAAWGPSLKAWTVPCARHDRGLEGESPKWRLAVPTMSLRRGLALVVQDGHRSLVDRVGRLGVTHQDRLMRFGTERVFCHRERRAGVLSQGEDAIRRLRKNGLRMSWLASRYFGLRLR